jgi:hypothetical protein
VLLLRTILLFLVAVGGLYALLLVIANSSFITNKARAKRFARQAVLIATAVAIATGVMVAIFSLEQ